MFNVDIDTNGINLEEAKEWTEDLANIYADMEVGNLSVSGDKISFDVGFSSMDDTQTDDIKVWIEEYLSMNEWGGIVAAGPIIVEPIPIPSPGEEQR